MKGRDISRNKNIEIQISADNMTAYIKLEKPMEDQAAATAEEMRDALNAYGIKYGIREAVLEKLAATPIYAFRMEAAKGLAPVSGEDGQIILHVKRDNEYTPEYTEEGTVDYKNINYFQMVEKGEVLCEIIPAGQGTDGMDIFGNVVTATGGKDPAVPAGANTSIDEENGRLLATCDGLVRFSSNRIDISEMLQIRGDVNNLTGNINFSGDVSVSGDVSNNISINAGGNVIIRGVVEDATVDAGGSLHVMNGINGDGGHKISAGKGLTCKYIENAIINVEGNITADYIIDSEVDCNGDIILTGTKEVLIGGDTRLTGELRARDIGNQKERSTRIEFVGVKTKDERGIAERSKEQEKLAVEIGSLFDTASRMVKQMENGMIGAEAIEQIVSLKQQIQFMNEKKEMLDAEMDLLKKREFLIYPGYISCKRKIYQGTKIYFGETRFNFTLDNIEHCRIYWFDGNIVQDTL